MDNPFMKENFAQLMLGAQKMQEKIGSLQEEIRQLRAVGDAGAGLVKITMNGERRIVDVEIDSSITGDLDMLRDLIIAAGNDASKKIEAEISQKTQAMIGQNLGSLL